MTSYAVRKLLLNNLPVKITWPSETWSLQTNTAMCPPELWHAWLSDSAKSSPHRQHGIDWSVPTTGDGHDSVFIQRS
jgi:hypothetical protein